MAKQKREIDVRAEMFSRVKQVYGLFILVGLCVVVRLIWVLAFSGEVAYNTDIIAGGDGAFGRKANGESAGFVYICGGLVIVRKADHNKVCVINTAPCGIHRVGYSVFVIRAHD